MHKPEYSGYLYQGESQTSLLMAYLVVPRYDIPFVRCSTHPFLFLTLPSTNAQCSEEENGHVPLWQKTADSLRAE